MPGNIANSPLRGRYTNYTDLHELSRLLNLIDPLNSTDDFPYFSSFLLLMSS